MGREGREEESVFVQAAPAPRLSPSNRGKALQVSYAVPGPGSAEVRDLPPALLGKAKSTRACFRGRFKPQRLQPLFGQNL